MALKKIDVITNKQIAEKGVQALADRPNLTGQYGTSGLSPAQLKLWFDKLATFLAERINTIVNALSAEDAASYIRIALEDAKDLGEVVESFGNGVFASKILKLLPSATATERQALQSVIDGVARDISNLQEDVLALDTSKLSLTQFNKEKSVINERISTAKTELNERIDGVDEQLNERVDSVDAKLVFLESQINRLVLYDEKSENLSIAPVNALYDAQTEELSLLANADYDENGESLSI